MNDGTLVGEVRVALGSTWGLAEGVRTMVPASLQARLQLEQALPEGIRMRVVLQPSVSVDDVATRGMPTVSWQHGLSEAVLVRSVGAWDVSMGLQRWSLGEMRLAPLMARDVAVMPGDPRGVWGVRGIGFLHPWRVEVGLTAEAARLDAPNDVTPGAWGTAVSMRYDAPAATLAGHAHAVAAGVDGAMVVALGTSASTTVASWVPYGEAWWTSPGGALRVGAGVNGYAGEVSWTVEGAWGPQDVRLQPTPDGGVARPQVRASAMLPLSARQTLDVLVGAAWPAAPLGGRTTQVDGSVSWLRGGEAHEVRVTGGWLHAFGATSLSLRIDGAVFF